MGEKEQQTITLSPDEVESLKEFAQWYHIDVETLVHKVIAEYLAESMEKVMSGELE